MILTALFMIYLYLRGSPIDSTIFVEDMYYNTTQFLEYD